MIRFEDYHRTIVGYHGTRLSVALDIVNRRRDFEFSKNQSDWLGHGVYFWEYAPQQALWWAERLKKKSRERHGKMKSKRPDLWDEPVAVLGSMIRLGFCLDLLDPYIVKYAKQVHKNFCDDRTRFGLPIPSNVRSKRNLDCAVFQYLYTSLEEGQPSQSIDSARGMYVSTDEKNRVWPGSWLYDNSHIQVCVRNRARILGTWLHYPQSMENVNGFEETQDAKDGVEPQDRSGRQATGEDVNRRTNPASGEGEIVDPGAGGRGP
jgi:hypothetical protein